MKVYQVFITDEKSWGVVDSTHATRDSAELEAEKQRKLNPYWSVSVREEDLR